LGGVSVSMRLPLRGRGGYSKQKRTHQATATMPGREKSLGKEEKRESGPKNKRGRQRERSEGAPICRGGGKSQLTAIPEPPNSTMSEEKKGAAKKEKGRIGFIRGTLLFHNREERISSLTGRG